MAEPENFEDDLFADLYDDNENATAPAPAPAPAPAKQEAAVEFAISEPEIAPSDGADAAPGADHNGGYGEDYQEEYEDEDEVDFNLGNGSMNDAAPVVKEDTPPAHHSSRGPSAKEDGKMFIGGLNWETTDQSLRDYFSSFGEVTECTVMRDGATGRSRGFGFLTFKDPKTVNIVMVKEHYLDGKIIDPKRAIPRDEQEKTSKIFVGGVSQETTEAEFKDYFAQFGRVVDATLMMDKDTGRPRGFGFVTFESEAGVDACLSTHLEIHGKPIEVKKAQPRGNMREEEDNSRRGKFRKGGGDDQNGNQNQMATTMAQAGTTPQAMAQYVQRMQQAMAMMQQQIAMNRGMAMPMMPGMNGMQMNPNMMQQMMLQMQMQQQQMAQGGGQNGQNSPMAAMMQMQNQMGQGGGQGNGDQQSFNNFGGGRGGRRGGRGGQQYNNQGGGYGMGGMGGGGGDPTSWEGMYDDVPQPNYNQGGRGGFGRNRGGGGHSQSTNPNDPNHAPPANAPTGPKNAGKPGANYRGGGRGGNRGFHPYSR